jgi:superfamily II RNA helicase
VQIKVLVEELYEARLIKVLYCTSTFALGVNMPARSAVFDDLQKFDGQEVRPLTVRQFMQKAGRAGRRGMDTVGHVVMRLDPDDYDRHRASIRRYLRGAYEPVRSSFNLSFNSVTNLIGRHDSEACRDLVYRSFLAWHLDHEAERATAEAARLEAAGASGKELRKLRRHAARSSDRCWHEFELKVGLLRDVGYIDAEGTFAAGARVLRHVQISEVFVTELVLNGVLEDLDDGTLFGLMCAIVSELPRGVTRHYHLPRSDIALVRTAERVLRAGVVTAADELAGTQTSFGPDLIPLGRAWHDGNSLDELMAKLSSRTDVSGSVISAFRRAKDLAGQLRQAYLDSGLDDHVDQLRRVLRAVSRDEVEVVA